MTKLKTKILKLISKKIYIIFAAFLLVFIITGLLLRIGKKPTTSIQKPLTFTRQFIGDYQYKGEIKGVMTTSFGKDKNEGKVEVERNGNKLSFSIPLANSSLSSDKDFFSPEAVSFTSPDKIIEAKYNLIPDGLKEQIILNKIPQENKLPIKLKTENLKLKISPEGIPVFYDDKDQYQFHFERPFMKDGAGNVSYGVKYLFGNEKKITGRTVKKLLAVSSKQTISATNMIIEIDSDWLHDPKRTLPIIIDPTIVHNTSSQFATGVLNRVADTGSHTTNTTPLATGGTITYAGGYAIHTFTGNGTFTPSQSLTTQVLVVAGGGGGGSAASSSSRGGGGGGAGGVLIDNTHSVTAQAYSVTVGTGGAGATVLANPGVAGNNSIFDTLTAIGGGRGGSETSAPSVGGSGGGGQTSATPANGAAGTSGQGYAGGNGVSTASTSGGGGGGAGGAGVNGGNAYGSGSAGGVGITSLISGKYVTYAVGGDGGGAHGDGGGTVTTIGGGGHGGGNPNGWNGANGTVIIRYYVGYTDSTPSLESYYQPLTTDPYTLGLWHLDEASGNVLDSSGNGNTGTPTGTSVVTGLIGNGRSIDGAAGSGISIAEISKHNDFTFETWAKMYSTGTGGTLITTRDGELSYNGTTNTFTLQMFADRNGGYDSNPATQYYYQPVITIPRDQWVHYAFIGRSDNTASFYINGNEVNIGTRTTDGGVTGDYQSGIGALKGSDNTLYYAWKGEMDEVRISNVARSPEMIKSDASRRPFGVYTSPVIDLTQVISWNSLSWTEAGVNTGDGETLSSSTSLVAQWNFNDTPSTATAVSGGSCGTTCNGTLTNFANTTAYDAVAGSGWTQINARWPISAPKALMLDGTNDFVSVTDNSSLHITSGLTISAWFKKSRFGSYERIVSKDNNSGQQLVWFLQTNSSDGINFGIGNAASNTDYYVTSSRSIIDGNWHHYVATYDGTTSKANLYIDGALDTTATPGTTGNNSGTLWSGNLETSTGPLTIGRLMFGSSAYYGMGTVDAVSIYSRALGTAEILSNYNAGNVELQTRVGNTTDPNDGSWEAWKPTTVETAIDSYDGPYQYNTTDSGLVSYWPMDETADNSCTGGVNDVCDKKGSNDGAATGTKIVDGKYGKARSFNGTSDQIDASATSLNITTDITVETWTNVKTLAANNPIISSQNFSTGNNNTAAWEMLGTAGGGIDVFMGNGSGYGCDTGAVGSLPTGSWHHTAFTVSGTSLKVYIDGVQVGSCTMSGSRQGYNTVRIGGYYNNGNIYFNGQIDETRIYNTALSATTIQQHYLEGSTRPETLHPMTDSTYKLEGSASEKIEIGRPVIDANIVALWHLDETGGTGAYIKDVAVNANNGTPTGTTVVNGISGKARSFNGSGDYINVSDTASLRPGTGAFTVSTWEKGPNSNVFQKIAAKQDGTTFDGWSLLQGGNWWSGATGKKICFGIGSSSLANVRAYCTVNDISDGNWHHVVGVSSGSVVGIYVDGANQSLTTNQSVGSWPNINQTVSLVLGNGPNFNQGFNGTIDEVQISSIARSDEEIAEAYRMGRDHYINKTISSTDLSAKTTLPFYVAADRPGTYLSATIGNSAFANYQTDANTMGLWHLDEKSGSGYYFKDASGKGHNLSGSPTAGTNGKIGKAATFVSTAWNNNTKLQDSAASTDFDIGTGFTIEAWIKKNSSTATYEHRVVGNRYVWNDANGWYLAFATSEQLDFSVQSAGAPTTNLYSTNNLSTNTWYYVVGVYDSGTLKLYINGQLNNTTTGAGYTSPNRGLTIGGQPDGANYGFDGPIDEVRVSNTARSAAQIRQAYEVGLRTHPITIDFGAKLDSGNLITDTSDLGFTVDATYYGLQQKGDALYPGDKVIVRENYNGTTYIAQGTVNSVTASTGAVTVAAWDSGSTFPSGGFTANADVFKWQREYWNIKNEVTQPTNDLNAVTNLTLRVTNGSEGRTIWLDDLRSAGDYLTTPGGSTITSSTGDRYFQYRTINHSFDEAVSASVTSVTIDYTPNVAPNTPSLDLPTNGAVSQLLSPVLKTTASDTNSDYMRYKIQLCTNSGMTTGCQTFDETSSQTGWSGQNTQTNTAYTSGTQGVYTIQTPLSGNTTYYWRSYAIDPAGSNSWSITQGSPYSFTTNYAPNTPTLDAPTNTATDQLLSPLLKTTTTDTESDYLRYKIDFCTNAGMTTGCQTFDETSSQTGWSGQNAQTSTAYTSGTQGVYTIQTPLNAATTYYWRSYAIDPAGSGVWSATQGAPYSFTTTTTPTAPTTPWTQGSTNPTGIITLTPYFSAIHNDPDADAAVFYEIDVNTNSGFTGTVMWATGQTAMSSLASGARSTDVSYAGSALSWSTVYYWRIRFTDNKGAVGAWSATQNFTMNYSPAIPSLDSPADTAASQPLLAVLKTTTTDTDSDYLRYKVQICTNSLMTLNCQTFDQTSSQTGWSGQNTQTSTAYTSGTQATYTLQGVLNPNTTYFWHSYGIDPAGTNTWGSTQTTPYSFTTITIVPPSAPTSLLTNGATNPIGLFEATPPYFSGIHHDDDNQNAVYYQIQVNTSSDLGGLSMWDSGKVAMTTTANGARSPNINYAGSTLGLQGRIYYWRIRFWDTSGYAGSWSSMASFTMSTLSSAQSCLLQKNPQNTQITISWIDTNSNEDGYYIEKNTDGAGFSSLITKSANSTSHIDSSISSNHTYGYRIRATYASDYSDWCTTTTLNLATGNFKMNGLQLNGIKLN